MKSLMALLLCLLVSCQVCLGQNNLFSGYTKKKDGLIDDVLTTTLSNDVQFPLVGLGVGNLPANRVENMIYEALKDENRIRMIDTAHASRNEKEVAKGITTGIQRFKASVKAKNNKWDDKQRIQVHVVTKVWYTYLGYERTKLSVRESLMDLSEAIKHPDVDLKVHILLHWPRCYDNIPWMHCEEEENNLPEAVKKLGPAPHKNKASMWKDSWRALEDMYESGDYPIAGIGISNFDHTDMTDLVLDVARIQPHLVQINVWSLVHDEKLIEFFHHQNIHMQVYNVMNGILSKVFNSPNAHHRILKVANELHTKSGLPSVTAAQVILRWLIQWRISIVPRTSNLDRLSENSEVALAAIPELTNAQLDDVSPAVAMILSGEDLKEDVFVEVGFKATNKDLFLYYLKGEEEEVQLAFIGKGDVHKEKTHPHHKFRLYNAKDPDDYHDYTVVGKYGDSFNVEVEL